MHSKTISKVIKAKVDDWLKSITDEELRRDLRDKIIVTGGCIPSMILGEPVNDYDVYLTDKEIVTRVARYYCSKFNEKNKGKKNRLGIPAEAWVLDGEDVDKWRKGELQLCSFATGYDMDLPYDPRMEWDYSGVDKITGPSGMLLNTSNDRVKIIINSDGIAEDSDSIADNVEYDINEYLDAVSDGDEVPIEEIDNSEYHPIFLSSNAITLSNKIQIIIRFYGPPEEIHKNYDFLHCMNYWDSRSGKVTMSVESLEAVVSKKLVYKGSKYPIASVIRTRKFLKRGYNINAGQYLKMAMQISKLDLGNIYVLEDQLVGVDSIYFLSFIREMMKSIEQGKTIDITGDYVVSVIDKIFN